MIGKISRQEVDMGIIPIYIRYDMFSILEFSATVGFSSTIFIVKAPEVFSNWSSIIAPFSFMIWVMIFVTIIVFGLALHKVLEQDFALEERNRFWPISKVYWNLFRTFVYQGINLDRINRFPSRFLIGIWLLSIFVLVSSYSGTLMSFMTYPKTGKVPRTFDELANSVSAGEYSCGIASTSIMWQNILHSRLKSAKIISGHIIENNNFVKLTEGINRVQKEKFALIYSYDLIKTNIPKEDSHKFVFSNNKFYTFMEAYAVKKNFHFSNQMNKIIRRIFEAGIIEKIDYASDRHMINTSEFQALCIDDIISPILLLVLGSSLAPLARFTTGMLMLKIARYLATDIPQITSYVRPSLKCNKMFLAAGM
ncbi:ionotropic receptor 21a-like [Centruroides vittatus]|uniref:ionotropic receptor 21a-like n=1 Tax=Centruroides vittatus TaxID=120091 RepID=UPI00350F4A38